ncbi:hypothetical protein LRM44_04070 [Candidatus Nanosynbacter sp. HMT-352]|uniref:hypothetical protein n=1 Tax=Candidatus Nanosynbacter sp. HMT-352 TaxID=2899133 RepID=UPI001FB5E168|nr:hypothetical protein [Candidatus Nanosynbacter sp. HMT-352]UOG66438.1 hypothetical protein LRM44_04070 [Candidatus Nanosynbacter sp. HMT-352]
MKLIKRTKTIFGVDKQEQIIPKAEPELRVGNIVAFKRGKGSEASYGTVIAVKDGKAVINIGTSIFRQMFILPFDELIVISSRTQEQSND